jgi:hypothetical protein
LAAGRAIRFNPREARGIFAAIPGRAWSHLQSSPKSQLSVN